MVRLQALPARRSLAARDNSAARRRARRQTLTLRPLQIIPSDLRPLTGLHRRTIRAITSATPPAHSTKSPAAPPATVSPSETAPAPQSPARPPPVPFPHPPAYLPRTRNGAPPPSRSEERRVGKECRS